MDKCEQPEMVRVKKVVQETPSIKSFYLDCGMRAEPGQFAMAWLPGVDEKPFTLTAAGKKCAVTVQEKGKFTQKMFNLEKGALVGIRGPYGKGFELKGIGKACIVAGGCGAAPILMLAEEMQRKGMEFAVVNGAKTGKECLFAERLGKTTEELYITTDDGSTGERGFATDALEKLLAKEKFDCVFGCGPEAMLKRVFELCEGKGAGCQLNLERYMRCGGMGVCGSCAIGGLLVCRDGPVFKSEQLREMQGLGEKAMLKCGKEVPLKEFSEWRQD